MHDFAVGPGDTGTVFQLDDEGREVPVRVEVVKTLTVPVPAGTMGRGALVALTASYCVRRLDNGEEGVVYADSQWAPDP